MRSYKAFILVCFSASAFSILPYPLHSQKKQTSLAELYSFKGNLDARQIRTIEQRLGPFFELKAGKNKSHSDFTNVYTPSQGDLFWIAKHWSSLSTTFKQQYTRATQIPNFMKYYTSPGGHFEIYYATAAMDSTNKIDTVSSADSYGFGPSNWRERVSAPNGVPDYIDEVAWAFDSAWSMEIDGMGFVQPLPYVPPGHTSSRFKVIAIDMDYHQPEPGYYGVTNPIPDPSGAPVGLRSYIEIRNQWVGWNDPDYGLHPEQGVRVTAVHEFFHAIQYAMVRQESGVGPTYQIDDFPLCWLEGTAALMENIGFDYIDDYLQYSEIFFDDPTSAIFNNGPSYVYTTVLLTMFLYERLETQPSIAFIKRMFFNNYNKYITFYDNLDSTSRTFLRTWPDIYGDFFAQSYYTGKRARQDFFVHDAPLFRQWNPMSDTFDLGYSISKVTPGSGMETFSLTQKKYPFDNGFLYFIGDSASPAAPFWGVHGILHSGGLSKDSVFIVPVPPTGGSRISMTNWSGFDSALFIVSNAQEGKNHRASLVLEPCPVTIPAGTSTIVRGVVSAPLSQSSAVSVAVTAHADLACSLSIASALPTSAQSAKSVQEGLVPIHVFYSIGFPATWTADAGMQLIVTESSEAGSALETQYNISAAAFAIFRWDEKLGQWSKWGAIDVAGATYQWKGVLLDPGLYGVFAKTPQLDSLNQPVILAYPNPVRKGSAVMFRSEGKVLMQLQVYSMSGALMYRGETENPVDTLKWSLANTSGKPIVPGMYYAWVGYKDVITKGLKRKKQKVLIIP